MKKRYSLYFTIILTFIILLIFYKKSNNKELESSIIYNKILNYSITKNLEDFSIDKNFQENSAEDYFFRGLRSYYNHDFLHAKEFLKHAELKNSKDFILFRFHLKSNTPDCFHILFSTYLTEFLAKITYMRFQRAFRTVGSIFTNTVKKLRFRNNLRRILH